MAQPVPVPQPQSQTRKQAIDCGLRLLGFTPQVRRPAACARVDDPTDAQLAALIASARRLAQRQRNLQVVSITPEVGERLLRLDWAVRAGETLLARRAASLPRPTKEPGVFAPAPTWQVGL